MNLQKKYYFALLRYCPSFILGEQVNIGILYFFPDENKVDFVFPSTLVRLKDFYPEVQLRVVREYLQHIKKTSQNIILETNTFFPENPQELIEKYFGLPNSVSIYFESPKLGFYSSIETLKKQHDTLYFQSYYAKTGRNPHDEAYLKQTFEKQLATFDFKPDLLEKQYIIQGKRSRIKFEYAWLNGVLNLVQPLSFDLTEASSIQNKSFTWFGKLNQIKQQITDKKIHIDFLLAEPQNNALKDSCDEAIENLKDIGDGIFNVIPENKIEDYAREVVKNAHN
jgi:hypothetical protein